jgi:hypothetical protein
MEWEVGRVEEGMSMAARCFNQSSAFVPQPISTLFTLVLSLSLSFRFCFLSDQKLYGVSFDLKSDPVCEIRFERSERSKKLNVLDRAS